MARVVIDVGSSPGDGTGDSLHTAGTALNAMTLELYNKDADLQSQIDAIPGASHAVFTFFEDFVHVNGTWTSPANTNEQFDALYPGLIPQISQVTDDSIELVWDPGLSGHIDINLGNIDEAQLAQIRSSFSMGLGTADPASTFEASVKLGDDITATTNTAFWGYGTICNFFLDGDMDLKVKDGNAHTAGVSTGITLTHAAHIYKIDTTDKADIKYYVDGVRVLSGTTFTGPAKANFGTFIEWALGKASGTDGGNLSVDYVSFTGVQRQP